MLLHTLQGHTGTVYCVVISGDCQLIASGSIDKTIKLWAVSTNQLEHTLQAHNDGAIHRLDFSNDGSRLVSGGGSDYALKLWEIKNGATPTLLRTLRGHTHNVWSVQFSPDDQKIASASDDMTVVLWSAQTGEQLLTFRGHKSWVYCLAWSPDGKLVASAGFEGIIRVFDAATGMPVRELSEAGNTATVFCLVFGATSDELISGGGDRAIRVWKLAEEGEAAVTRRLEGHTGAVRSIALSPDKRYIVSGSGDGTLRVWKVAMGQLIRVLEGHEGPIHSVVWMRDGQTIVSGSSDETVRTWKFDAQVRDVND
jgi:WD40 repeat protein